jgi:hypothetical protein
VCGTGTWIDLPSGSYSLREHSNQPLFKKVQVTFGNGTPRPSTDGAVDIRWKVKATTSNALGWGGGSPTIYLCTGQLRQNIIAADRDPMQRSDLTHEMGHALGLLNGTPFGSTAHEAWRDTANGRHCNQGQTGCAMWWMSATDRPTTFHGSQGTASCHDELRKQEYVRGNMSHWSAP